MDGRQSLRSAATATGTVNSGLRFGHALPALRKKIASKLYTIKGVRSVATNVKSHVALITPSAGQQVSARRVWETLESIEFTPVKMVTPAGIFVKKPAA